MRRGWIVARWEVRVTLRQPGFWVFTLGLPLIVASFVVLLAGTPPAPTFEEEAARAIGAAPGRPFGYLDASGVLAGHPPEEAVAFASVEEGRDALRRGEIEFFLDVPADYLSEGEVKAYTAEGSSIRWRRVEAIFREAVLAQIPSPQARAIAARGVRTETFVVDGAGRSSPDDGTVTFGGMGLGMLTAMMLWLLVGRAGLVLHADREGKVLELMLSTMTARSLIFGRLFAGLFSGAIQLATWGIVVAARAATAPGNAPALLDPVSPGLVALCGAYVVGGYLFAAPLSAAIAALRQFPVLALCNLLSFVGLFAPHSTLAVAFSLFPISAGPTMLLRLGVADVPAWQIAASLSLLALAAPASIVVSSKLFRAAHLLTGQRVGLAQLARTIGRA